MLGLEKTLVSAERQKESGVEGGCTVRVEGSCSIRRSRKGRDVARGDERLAIGGGAGKGLGAGEWSAQGRGDGDTAHSDNERWRMTMPNNPPASNSRALAQQRYNQAIELEKQLRPLLHQRGLLDANVKALKNRICESYEAVILEDRDLAEQHEVEQAIWRLYYKYIEEFRARIRKSNAAASAAASSPPIPMAGAKTPSARRDSPQKILSIFKSFLAEATGFYHNLILKLRAKHGLPQDYSPFEAGANGTAGDKRRAAELKGCDLSCHRCLIFLGDLARYKESHSEADVRTRDWSVAAGYYQQAISLWPSSGNPHNQLAVLATYVGDEMLAVYRYFRSLAVESPFLTARDNLIILFEKNRNHYAQLLLHDSPGSTSKAESAKSADGLKPGRGGDRLPSVGDEALKLAVKVHKSEGADITEIQKGFRIRFVRLNGLLFTKTSLETFAEVYSAIVRELESLLSPDDTALEAGLGSDHGSSVGMSSAGAAGFLHLVAMLIFTVHNISWGPDSHHPTYAEILQRSALFQHAFTAAFECAGWLVRRCSEFKEIPKSPLLPAVLVFLEWLACRPEMAAGSDVDDKQTRARLFFWKQSTILLNFCNENVKKVQGAEFGLEGSRHALNSFEEEESSGGVALWEDYELRGFVAVVPAQIALDYSRRAPRAGLGDKFEREVRVQRLLAAGKAIANSLEGTEKGIWYDEDLQTFFMAGEVPEKSAQGGNTSLVDDGMNVLPDDIADEPKALSTAWGKVAVENSQTPVVLQHGPVTRRDEEDEEVIVFKPVMKDSHAVNSGVDPIWKDLATIPRNALATSGLVAPNCEERGRDVLLNNQSPGASQKSGFDVYGIPVTTSEGRPKQSLVDLMSSQSPILASVKLPRSQDSNSVVGCKSGVSDNDSFLMSNALPSVPGVLSLLKGEDVSGRGSTYGHAPGSAEDWLNQIGKSSSASFNSPSLVAWDSQPSASNGFGSAADKLAAAPAGIIGQSKQPTVTGSSSLWSTAFEPLSAQGLSYLNLGITDYNAQVGGGLGGTVPHSLSLENLIQACAKDSNVPTYSSASVTAPSATRLFPTSDQRTNAVSNGAIGRQYVQNSSSGSDVSLKPSPFGEVLSDASTTPRSLSIPKSNGSPKPSAPTSSNLTASRDDAAASSTRLSGMKPPPGFGPLPTKQLSPPPNSVQQSPPSLQQAAGFGGGNDWNEPQQVDDYGWLDDYSNMKKTGREGFYRGRGSSLYSSDYGIWSTAPMSETTHVSNVPRSYPFPGMIVSEQEQLEKQKQLYSAQLLQQILQQQQQQQRESPGMDYRVNQPQAERQVGAQPYDYDTQQLYGIQQQQYLQSQQQQQQQQQQQLWLGKYQSRDPFVS